MIGIVIALPSEAERILNTVEELKSIKLADKPAYTCKICGRDAVIAISGIGKVSAGLTTQLLIDKFSPDFILNFGTCGGVNSSVKILNYYIVEKCCQYDFDLTDLEDVPLGYIQEYKTVFFNACTDGISLEKSVLASADRFTNKQVDIDNINKMGGSLCDMEGGAIAQVCTSNNTPLYIIKGITDVNSSGTAPEQFFSNLKQVSAGFPAIIIRTIEEICKSRSI